MKNVEISVYCLAYNCVNFIEKSINGMLNQKIDVEYKIIIHDDASDDGTADIIRSYAEHYSEKIYAILQLENQYSKGIRIYEQYIEPNVEGRYIAICEGDDYWTDENKLQLQYNYMEKHPECILCTHNSERYDLKKKQSNKFNDWNYIHVLTAEDVFMKWCVHTSSYFIRRNCKEWQGNRYWFGDYMKLTWAFYQGQIVSLPQVMSVYNAGNPNGLVLRVASSCIDKRLDKEKDMIRYLNEYNEITNFQFDKYVQEKIEIEEFECLQIEYNNVIKQSKSKLENINIAKKIVAHNYYITHINERVGIKRVLTRYKYEGYIFYPLWKFIVKKHVKNRIYR